MNPIPLSDSETDEVWRAAASIIPILPNAAEAIHPLLMVKGIAEALKTPGLFPPEKEKIVINKLGLLYGQMVIFSVGWKWYMSDFGNETYDYAVVEPSGKYYVLPRIIVWNNRENSAHNLELHFRMICEGNLPAPGSQMTQLQ